ncbi:MAG: CopG family transcriptional regulator [Rhodospirillales bacterium 69-11]|jgi:predicted transcriptional regulator|nr:MAG: CopG family transcriptional regulator [Rhodospirillales bacterium 69-11]
MKSRHHFYIERALMKRLDQLAEKPGVTRSAILEDSLRAYLDRRGASELDDKFKQRLDRLSMQLGRIERDVGIVLESLALFVRYELTVTAPLPEDDQVSRTIGQERFQAFLDQVCRRIAGGKDFRAEVLARNGSEVRHDH